MWAGWQLLSPFHCQGIIKRDEIVFRAAKRRGIPILMVTSGGYQKKTARIIADSILNLHRQGLIGAEAADGEGSSLVTHMMRSSGSAGSAFTAVWGALILELTLTSMTFKGTEVTLYLALCYCVTAVWIFCSYCCRTELLFQIYVISIEHFYTLSLSWQKLKGIDCSKSNNLLDQQHSNGSSWSHQKGCWNFIIFNT